MSQPTLLQKYTSDLSPPTDHWLYPCARGLMKHIFHGFWRMEVCGVRHIPAEGPFLLASNHASFLDPPLAGVAASRPMYFFARKTLFRFAPLGKLLRGLHSIPVDRDGDSDISAFRQVFTVLKQGHPLLVFPEGTRSSDGHFQAARRGVGMIACRLQVPVVPLRVGGTYNCYSRHHKFPRPGCTLTATFGPPLLPSDYDPGKQDPQRYHLAAQNIMQAITRLQIPVEAGI